MRVLTTSVEIAKLNALHDGKFRGFSLEAIEFSKVSYTIFSSCEPVARGSSRGTVVSQGGIQTMSISSF